MPKVQEKLSCREHQDARCAVLCVVRGEHGRPLKSLIELEYRRHLQWYSIL